MPNKPLTEDATAWVNFMREFKRRYPVYEHMSRNFFYPFASKFYKQFKKFYDKNYKIKNKKNEISAIVKYFDNLKK